LSGCSALSFKALLILLCLDLHSPTCVVIDSFTVVQVAGIRCVHLARPFDLG
jgi:hypothetical protein